MSYLEVLFNPEEYAGAGNTPNTNQVFPIGALEANPRSFITLNPIKAETTRADSNVSALRNFLVEIDSINSHADQRKYVESLGLPYSCITTSGNKSLHFVVALKEDLKDERAWRIRAKAILEIYAYADQSTKNPSRYTRMAGARRFDNGNPQELVEARDRIELGRLDSWLREHGKVPVLNKPPLSQLSGWKKSLLPDTKDFLINGAEVGTINNRSFACAINLLEAGYNKQVVQYWMVKTAEKYGYNTNEIIKTIKSAVNKQSRSK